MAQLRNSLTDAAQFTSKAGRYGKITELTQEILRLLFTVEKSTAFPPAFILSL